MDYNIIVTPFAEFDLKEAKDYYNRKKSGLGNEFIDEVKHLFTRIKQNPELFSTTLNKTRKAVLRRFPYNTYFVIDDQTIYITAVFNTWQHPKIWKNRQ